MSVKKIFIVLITIVACVIVGALVLNVLLPNVATTLVDSLEDMIYKATKMSFDFNGNNNVGDNHSGTYNEITEGGDSSDQTAGVDGFN